MNRGIKIFFITVTVILLVIAAILFYVPYIVFKGIFSRPSRSTKVPDFYKDSPHYKVSRAGMKVMDTLYKEILYFKYFNNRFVPCFR